MFANIRELVELGRASLMSVGEVSFKKQNLSADPRSCFHKQPRIIDVIENPARPYCIKYPVLLDIFNVIFYKGQIWQVNIVKYMKAIFKITVPDFNTYSIHPQPGEPRRVAALEAAEVSNSLARKTVRKDQVQHSLRRLESSKLFN